MELDDRLEWGDWLVTQLWRTPGAATVVNRDIKDKTPNSESEANVPNVSHLSITLHTGCNVD
jgi:hypothetical protein